MRHQPIPRRDGDGPATTPLWVATAVLMASLPPALNVFVMASQYQTYVERASSTILVGTVASVVTVTELLALIVRHGVR
jgi:predicted permease